MRAANKAQNQQNVDERGRRKNAAQRARALAQKKADSMPVVNPLDGPKRVRVVNAELVDPSPVGGIGEVLANRYLLKLIVGRELAQMYAASVLGLMWSYVQPAMRFATYYLIMGVIMKMHRDTPYFAIHLFVGMVMVHYFSETWNGGTRSIWQNRALVLKMRMPREVFPMASAVVAAYHTFPQIAILAVCCLIIGWHFSWGALAAGALGLAILISFSMALGLFFSAVNVFARDFQNVVGTITQVLHFMVPMMYPFGLVYAERDAHPWLYQIYVANPLSEAVLLMQKFFWLPLVDTSKLDRTAREFLAMPPDLWIRGLIQLAICLILLYLAQRFFSRVEGKFPERL